MNSYPVLFKKSATLPVLLIVAALLAAVLIAGCGGDSPSGAVNQYLGAWQSGDWNAFKAAVVPQQLTKDQEALAKEKFDQVKVKVEDLQMTTEYDKSDKNKAKVVLTGGKMTYTANILGEKKTETKDVKTLEKESRTYDVVKIKDVWYVDTKLG